MADKVAIYKAEDGSASLTVHLEEETVWLSLNQLAMLFGRDKAVISRHLRNIFKSGELDRDAAVAKFATTAADGKTYRVDFYNPERIISDGYRVNSKRGVQFRQWTGRVLRDHLVQGYTLNQQRLQEQGEKLAEIKKAEPALLHRKEPRIHRRQQAHRGGHLHLLSER